MHLQTAAPCLYTCPSILFGGPQTMVVAMSCTLRCLVDQSSCCWIAISSPRLLPPHPFPAGGCNTTITKQAINHDQQASIWFPPTYPPPLSIPALAPSIPVGVNHSSPSKAAYLSAVVRFGTEWSRALQDCSINNGGCGVRLCVLNARRQSSKCVDPRGELVCLQRTGSSASSSSSSSSSSNITYFSINQPNCGCFPLLIVLCSVYVLPLSHVHMIRLLLQGVRRC